MPKITFIDPDGATHTVEAEVGWSVMETAMKHAITGIIASCGGSCACATCHVYVDEAWTDKVKPPSLEESDMIDTAIDIQPNSRLSCQLRVTEALDGLTVRIAARQI